MSMSVDYHAEPGDTFSADIREMDGLTYAVIAIHNRNSNNPVTIYTPHGRTWTRDYLEELRDALNNAIVEIDAIRSE